MTSWQRGPGDVTTVKNSAQGDYSCMTQAARPSPTFSLSGLSPRSSHFLGQGQACLNLLSSSSHFSVWGIWESLPCVFTFIDTLLWLAERTSKGRQDSKTCPPRKPYECGHLFLPLKSGIPVRVSLYSESPLFPAHARGRRLCTQNRGSEISLC